MKKVYVTIIVLFGMILCGSLFANKLQADMDKGTGAGIQIPQQYEQYAENPADSIRSESQSGAKEVPDDIRDRLADIFKNLEDFSSQFNDSVLFNERFHDIFDAEFQQKVDHIRSEVFNERFFERLQEGLMELNKQDFRIELDEDFMEQLQEKLGEMRMRLEELDQQIRDKKGRGRAI